MRNIKLVANTSFVFNFDFNDFMNSQGKHPKLESYAQGFTFECTKCNATSVYSKSIMGSLICKCSNCDNSLIIE